MCFDFSGVLFLLNFFMLNLCKILISSFSLNWRGYTDALSKKFPAEGVPSFGLLCPFQLDISLSKQAWWIDISGGQTSEVAHLGVG